MTPGAETDFVIDFGDAPPAQGGGGSDYVPPGTYVLAIDKATAQMTASERPAVVVNFVVAQPPKFKGKRLQVWFVTPRQGTNDSKFPAQRLNALFIALGYQPMDKPQQASAITKALTGKQCLAEIEDQVQPAKGQYKERTTSNPVAFWHPKSEGGQKALAKRKQQAEAPAAEQPAPAAQELALASEPTLVANDEPAIVLAGEPEPAAAEAAAEQPRSETDLASELDGMFQ